VGLMSHDMGVTILASSLMKCNLVRERSGKVHVERNSEFGQVGHMGAHAYSLSVTHMPLGPADTFLKIEYLAIPVARDKRASIKVTGSQVFHALFH
jgi:hypothetical protein